jgi:hypothetical protein
MGLKCSICAHEKRKEIDKALVAPDANFSAIARIFFGSTKQRDALRRHVEKGHIVAKITKAAQAQAALESDDLFGELQQIQKYQSTIFEEARKRKKDGFFDPDNRLALEALRDQSRIVELKARIQGAFKDPKQQGAHSSQPTTQIIKTIIEIPDNGRGPKSTEPGE